LIGRSGWFPGKQNPTLESFSTFVCLFRVCKSRHLHPATETYLPLDSFVTSVQLLDYCIVTAMKKKNVSKENANEVNAQTKTTSRDRGAPSNGRGAPKVRSYRFSRPHFKGTPLLDVTIQRADNIQNINVLNVQSASAASKVQPKIICQLNFLFRNVYEIKIILATKKSLMDNVH
jgi:hypothetical protein